MTYETFDDVVYQYGYPSGKAFLCSVGGVDVSIPQSAVHDDSEIYLGTEHRTGTLVVARWLAEDKGLTDAKEGSGLPLKRLPRSRVTPPEYGVSEGQLKRADARARAATTAHNNGCVVMDDGGDVAGLFDCGDEALDVSNARFAACGPSDVLALVEEVKMLRRWAARVTGGK